MQQQYPLVELKDFIDVKPLPNCKNHKQNQVQYFCYNPDCNQFQYSNIIIFERKSTYYKVFVKNAQARITRVILY